MYIASTIVSAVFMVLSVIFSLRNLFSCRWYEISWPIINVCIGVFVFASFLFGYSLIQIMKNYFVELHTTVQAREANIGILEKQYRDLVKKLEDLVEKYFSHEKGLLDAVKSRSAENLSILLENYPELKAMGGTRELIGKIVSLRSEISNAQQYFNSCARDYNEYARKAPYNKIIPDGMEKEFAYINFDSDSKSESGSD